MSVDHDRRVRWVLALGLFCISFPAILVRYAAAPALSIAFWRKLMAAAILAPLVIARLRKEPVDWRQQVRLLPYTVGTGLILALHFGTWIASVKYTTIASSLLLISTQPVWGGVLGWIFLREPVPRKGIVAIVLAMTGVAIIVSGDLARGHHDLFGDALALVAAMAAAVYLTVGRHVRARIPLTQYLFVLYVIAAGGLGVSAWVAGDRFTGFDGRTWLMFALLALFPSTLGHNLLNYAVRHMETYRVNLSVLVEPVVSIILAAVLFAEIPGPRFYFGAVFVFAGVVIALSRHGDSAPKGEWLRTEPPAIGDTAE